MPTIPLGFFNLDNALRSNWAKNHLKELIFAKTNGFYTKANNNIISIMANILQKMSHVFSLQHFHIHNCRF